jgi:PAS domain S-box-containing protein
MNRNASQCPAAAAETDPAQTLRERAEETIKGQPLRPPENLAGMTPIEMQRLIHEWRVHQIEVEAQNEELQRQHAELVAAAARNANLTESLLIKSMAFDLAINAISVANTEGILTQVNAAFLRLWGYASTEEVIGKPIPHFIQDPQDAAAIIAALNDKGCWEGPYTAKRKDGSSFIAHGQATLMRDETGRLIGFQSSVMDITERREMEAALENSRLMLAETEQIGKVGGWELDLEHNRLTWTEEIYRIHEVDLAYELTVEKAIAFYTPESQPVVERAVQRAIEFGEPFDLEMGLITAKGNLKAVHSIGRADLVQGKLYGFFQDITERKQSEQALRELHEVFNSFMRHTPVYSYIAAVTQTESRIVHASDNYEQMFGRTVAEILGRPTTELFPPEVAARLHDLDWQVATTGKTIRTEAEVNGRTYATVKFPIVQGSRTLVAGYTIDITEQKQAERTLREWNQTLEDRVAERTMELQQSKARFRQLSDTTFEGIAISEDGILIDGNAQLGAMHGCELAEMIGRPLLDFIAPEARTKVAENIRKGDEVTYECLSLRKDGSIFPMEVHGRMGSWQGRTLRLTALRDLTETKRLAAEFLAQQTALEHAQRLTLVSEVCAGIVHQISQPLCAMGANLAFIQAGLAAAPETGGETMETLRELIDSVACIREVIHHLRTLLQPGQAKRLPTDLNRVLEEALPLLRQEAGQRGIRLAVELRPDLPTVLAAGVLLNQVILNLTRNAFDACIACPPDQRRVVITTSATPSTAVELSVRDTGTGIAPEVIEHLFAPFFSTKAGMGIGLRLSRTIVESHGGSIEARNNTDGIGATFRVTLPELPQPSAID